MHSTSSNIAVSDKDRPIYLASASPRRRELLEQLGLPFTVVVRPVDESHNGGLSPDMLVEALAEKKARAVACEVGQGLVIGSDTVVVWRGRVMGKPVSRADALDMLKKLQGSQHQVYSGVAVIDAGTGKKAVSHECTRVIFRPATDEELDLYIDTGEPFGKAGAYAVQGLGAVFVKGIMGCYSNVVGLPLARLSFILKEFGVEVLKYHRGEAAHELHCILSE